MKVSQLATNLIGSEIIKIGNEVNELKAAGAEIANLTIGDLNSDIYPIPEQLRAGIKSGYDKNLTNYPPANGLLSLRKALANDLKNRWNLEYSPEEILIAGGSRPLIYAVYKTIVDEGEKVVYPIPSWNNNHYAYLSSAQKVEVETRAENRFLPTAEELKPHLKDAVLLSLCSPLNPTGTMFDQQQLSEICEMVIEENKSRAEGEKPLYIMYDQIYSLLTFDGEEHFHPVGLYPELRDYTIYVDGISKCLAATGVRVGWSFGPKPVIDYMKSLLGHIGAWAPKAEQQATADFWSEHTEVNQFVDNFKNQMAANLRILHKGFQNLKEKGFPVDSIQPMGALYLTVKMDFNGKKKPDGSTIENSSDLVFYLINDAGAAFVPFSAFGNSKGMPYFRASAGGVSKEEIEAMFPRLEAALEKLV